MDVDVFFHGAGALADSVRIWGLAWFGQMVRLGNQVDMIRRGHQLP